MQLSLLTNYYDTTINLIHTKTQLISLTITFDVSDNILCVKFVVIFADFFSDKLIKIQIRHTSLTLNLTLTSLHDISTHRPQFL